MDVSIIIVNYNCDQFLANCLNSIYNKTQGLDFEIIVVDNDSTDQSIANTRLAYPGVKIIENKKNLGFGGANNIGAQFASGKYLLLLNPDTILENNALKHFVDFAQSIQDEMGCCGGNLLDEFMQPANLGGNFPSLFQQFSDIGFRIFYPKFYKRKVSLLMTINDLVDTNQIDCICGANLFIKKTVFDELSGFDEDYFLYYEDTDLCYRLKAKGYKNYIVKEANITHLESVIISDSKAEKLNLRKFGFSEKSKQLFFKKSYGQLSVWVVKLFTVFNILVRLIAHKGNIKTYLKMIFISLKMKSN